MKEDKFIKQNSETWKKLEGTLNRLKSRSLYRFDKNELDDFINVYNLTCGHLSYCRTYYGNTSTTSYLNRIVADAHSYIYTTKKSNIKNLIRFFVIEFPLLVRSNLKFILLSASLFLLGTVLSFIFTLVSTDNAVAFFPPQAVEEILNRDLGEPRENWDAGIHSNFILTNNIKVGMMAFAFGVTLGLGTSYVLVVNGFNLGTLAALFYYKKANLLFWSLILPHGIIELFAVFICGGAGLIIGYSIINPGIYTRKDAFIIRGKAALKLVLGTIPLFIVAGFIEGYFTPLNIPEISKITFALVTFTLCILYIVIPNIKYKLNDKIDV